MRQLPGLLRLHAVLPDQMVLYLLELDEPVALPLAAVALVDLIELDPQLHLLLLVELLFSLELRLGLQVLLLVADLLPLLQLLLIVNCLEVVAHVLCLGRVLDGHLGLRMHVVPVHVQVVEVHYYWFSL